MTRFLLLTFLVSSVLATPMFAQNQLREPIVLRDLSLLKNKTIASYDVDSVLLDDLSNLGWDQIISAPHPDKKFHEIREKLSLPLYRLKKRMKNRDYTSALAIATKLEPLVKETRGANYQLTLLAQVAGHLARSERPSAAVALFRLMECDDLEKNLKPYLTSGSIQLDFDTGLCQQLVPVFFDSEGCRSALIQLKLMSYDQQAKRKNGLAVYATALCLGAAEFDLAAAYLEEIDDTQLKSDWERTMGALDLAARGKPVDFEPRRISSKNEPAAKVAFQFAIGASRIRSKDQTEQERGALELLTLPAVYGDHFPETAAAALEIVRDWSASNKRQDRIQSIEKEIRANYSNTFVGARFVKPAPDPSQPPGSDR